MRLNNGVHGEVGKREGMEASEPWEMAAMARLMHIRFAADGLRKCGGEGKSEGAGGIA